MPTAHEKSFRAGTLGESGPARFRIGTAGWSIPSAQASLFPGPGSHLERYASRLNAVEINSSFYRHHLPKTYSRWAESTPSDFQFSVKLAREFTHTARLAPNGETLRASLQGIAELGTKWAVLLVQLPPSLPFEETRAERFLDFLREHCRATTAWEPRHASWASERATALLERYGAVRVLADPDPCPASRNLCSDSKLRYYRLHGNPEIYRSRYRPAFLRRLAASMASSPTTSVWCVFDNTTYGFSHENALELNDALHGLGRERIVS